MSDSDYIPSADEIAAALATPPQPAQPLDVVPSAPPRAVRPAPRRGPGAIDELPPHDLQAEQGVLGCVLLDPGASMDLLSEQLSKAGGDAFYDLRHRAIFEAVASMWDRQVKIDLITLRVELDNAGKLQAVGGLPYIAGLQDAVPSAAHLPYYVAILIEKWTARELLRFSAEIGVRVRECPGEISALVADIQTDALRLTDGHVKGGPRKATELIKSVYERMAEAQRGQQEITGLKTDLHYLDNMTCGLQAGELVVIGARPSVGKTALGVTISLAVLRALHPVLFFSVEMADGPIMHRFLGAGARVDTRTMRNGFLSETFRKRLTLFQEECKPWLKNLYIESRSAINGRDVFVTTRRMIREAGIKLVVIDYLQLMEAVHPSDSRVNDVAEISRWVKRTAKDLGVSVVAMAQLNRESAKSRNAKPTMADLRESGQIEQDADVIGLLYRPDLGKEPEYEDMRWIKGHDAWCPKDNSPWLDGPKITLRGGPGEEVTFPEDWRSELDYVRLDICKNRQGETGECDLVFQKRATAFVDAYRKDYGKTAKQAKLAGVEI